MVWKKSWGQSGALCRLFVATFVGWRAGYVSYGYEEAAVPSMREKM
jgi:hypothetical protein